MSLEVRTYITMVVLLGILAAGAWYGWTGLTGGSDATRQNTQPATPTPTQTCTPRPPVVFTRSDIRVSVFNAGAPSGTAQAVLNALVEQGFRRGDLGNTGEPLPEEGVVIRSRAPQSPRVKLVRRQFVRAEVVESADRLGRGVNILITGQFRGLAQDAPRRIRVERGDVCTPVETTTTDTA